MIPADPAVLARIGSALVNIDLALFAAVAGFTVTDELIDAIFAASAMFARVRTALVNVAQTTSVVVSTRALTTETVDHVNAHAPVGTGVGSTLIDVILAVLTREARNTLAVVAGNGQTQQHKNKN